MKNESRELFKRVAAALQSSTPDSLEELALTADELAGAKHHLGDSALHLCAELGRLDEIKCGVTARQLAQAVNPEGISALFRAAHFGCLHQVKGGVTVEQLKGQKNPMGGTALMQAAQDGYLHQIAGDITVADLDNERLDDNTSALHHAAFQGQLYLLKDGVTADELAAARADDGKTALHAAASSRCLDQIKGGVTLAQMTAVKDAKGLTPLYWAAREGSLNQISGGVTTEQMQSALCDGKHSAWDIAAENLNTDQIADAEAAEPLANLRKDKAKFLGLIQMACEGAVHEINNGDKQFGERMLIKAGIDGSWNGDACGRISEAYLMLGNLQEAFKFGGKSVEHPPASLAAWQNFAGVCLVLKKYHQAVLALEQALHLNPQSTELMILLALAKSELGHPPAEVEALSRKAVETDPDYLTGWQWLAAVLEENGKHEESDQAHYEFCKRKLGGEAVEFGFAEGLPAGFLVTKEGVELLRKDGLISDGDPALN